MRELREAFAAHGVLEVVERAHSYLRQGLEPVSGLGNPGWTASAFNLAAGISAARGDNRTGAVLWGVADALSEDAASSVEDVDARVREKPEASARSALGPHDYATAAAEGHAMPVEQALRLALEPTGESAPY